MRGLHQLKCSVENGNLQGVLNVTTSCREQLNDNNVSEPNPDWSATEETENREPK